MIKSQGEANGIVSRVIRTHAIGTMAEDVSKADRIILCIVVVEPGADTPHESIGATLGRKGFAVDEEGAAAFDIPGQFSG